MKKYLLFPLLYFSFSITLNAQGDLQWLQQISDVDDDIDTHQMCIDPAGNIYVGGSFDEQVASGSPTQPKFSGIPEAALNEQNGFIAKYNSAGARQWISKFGSPHSTTGYSPLAMTESGGFLYVVGSFQFSSSPGLDFDPGVGTTTHQSVASSGSDFFVSKYNTTTGALVWAYTGGSVGGGADLPRGVVVDNAGDIYVSGYVNNSGTPVDFDIKAGTAANANGTANVKQLYLVKYDANCNFIWRNNILNSSDNSGGSLTYDAVNNYIYMTGGVGKNAGGLNPKFPSVSGGLTTLNVNASDDGFVAKYNTSGDLQWVKNLAEGTSSNYFWSIDVDNTGNIYVGGVMQGTADFDPTGTRNLTSAGSLDASFAKYDANGNYLWAYRMGSASFGEACYDIRVTPSGKVMMAGAMYGMADYNPEGTGGAKNKGVNGSRYIFFGEYDTNFKYQWAHAIGPAPTGNNYANAATIDENDPLNPIYLWGYMGQGTTEDFDPNNAGGNYTATGTKDNGFLAKYSTSLTLPIKLLSFDASLNVNVVDLTWVTTSEINNDYFTIERSTSGFDFEPIGTISGAGNSNTILHYSFLDDNLPQNWELEGNTIYYRLKQTDFDGKYEYSKIIAVNTTENNLIRLHPNPTSGKLWIQINNDTKASLYLEIRNMLGQKVFTENKEENRKKYNKYIDLSKYGKGTYFLKVILGKEIQIKQIIVQ